MRRAQIELLRTRRLAPFVAACLLALAPAASRGDGGGDARFATFPFHFHGAVERILLADVDGDGLEDILRAAPNRLDLFFQDRRDGFALAGPGAKLELPGRAVGWDLDRRDDATRVVAFVDGRQVVGWRLDPKTRKLDAPEVILDKLPGFLPDGTHHLRFVRDVDGDGRADFIIPGSGLYHIYLRKADGTFAAGVSIASDVTLDSRLTPDDDLETRVGQSIRVPVLTLRDVNADGRRDVVSRTEDRLEIYLARAGAEFPRTPTSSLDLAAVRARVGAFDPDRLDFSNLSSLVLLTFQTELQDLDGDGIEDLLLREGGKVSVFGGRKDGLDLELPRQVLKSGGNVVTAVLADEDGDGAKDLWLVRLESVSIGDVFVWLVLSGSVDIEAFVYRNEGERFARRPSRKLTVTISFPSILSLLEIGPEIEEKLKKTTVVPRARLGLEETDKRGDLVVLDGGRLRFYANGAGEGRNKGDVLDLIDYRRDVDEYSVDIERLLDRVLFGADGDLAGVAGRDPDFELALPGNPSHGAIHIADLNGDGRDDMVVLTGQDGFGLDGVVALSRR